MKKTKRLFIYVNIRRIFKIVFFLNLLNSIDPVKENQHLPVNVDVCIEDGIS